MATLDDRQKAALAIAIGFIEARLEIDDRPESTSRWVYRGLARAFPELADLFEDRHLREPEDTVLHHDEPCS